MSSPQVIEGFNSTRTPEDVAALRPRWQPARFIAGGKTLAEVEYDDDSGFWIARSNFAGRGYDFLTSAHDTFSEAVAAAEAMLRKWK